MPASRRETAASVLNEYADCGAYNLWTVAEDSADTQRPESFEELVRPLRLTEGDIVLRNEREHTTDYYALVDGDTLHSKVVNEHGTVTIDEELPIGVLRTRRKMRDFEPVLRKDSPFATEPYHRREELVVEYDPDSYNIDDIVEYIHESCFHHLDDIEVSKADE